MVGIGIIGCGKISQVRHIPEYEANPDARVVALYDVNLDRARELAVAHGARAYATMGELLADPDVDAVSVCTSNATHAEATIAALPPCAPASTCCARSPWPRPSRTARPWSRPRARPAAPS